MSVSGRNQHYRWAEVLPRHWPATAHACNFGAEAGPIIEALIERTPAAVAEVAAKLPADFPASVAEPILDGLEAAARKLSTGAI